MDGLDFFAMKGLAESEEFFEFAIMHIKDIRSAGAFVFFTKEIIEEKEKEQIAFFEEELKKNKKNLNGNKRRMRIGISGLIAQPYGFQ